MGFQGALSSLECFGYISTLLEDVGLYCQTRCAMGLDFNAARQGEVCGGEILIFSVDQRKISPCHSVDGVSVD